MKKFIIPAVVLVILIIPSVLYLGITTGKHNFGNLPYFGPRQAHDTTDTKGRPKVDTAYYKVPAFEFTNQDGKPYGTTNLDGKVYVANFIATTNTDTTKKMSVLMQEVQKKIKGDYRIKAEDFRIISFSANPEADSLPALKTYSKRLMADSMLWNFVTGNKADINTLATKGYLLNNKQDLTVPSSTLICGKFVLVDKERHIRGIYDGTNIEQVNRMVEDIKVLFANYRIPRKGTDNGSPKVEQRH
jgi:protein SCO1/2